MAGCGAEVAAAAKPRAETTQTAATANNTKTLRMVTCLRDFRERG